MDAPLRNVAKRYDWTPRAPYGREMGRASREFEVGIWVLSIRGRDIRRVCWTASLVICIVRKC